MSNVKNDSATWKSTATTSITWVTRTGPDQGKASVTIDGVNEGTLDLYSAVPAVLNKVYTGLAKKVHTVVINVLHAKNPSSTGFNVRLDAFVVGAATTQESDPKIQYDTWNSSAQALATNATYRSTTNNKALVTVTFTGTSIDWITVKGKAYGKASVKIDGLNKGTIDLYKAATTWQSLVSFNGLSAGPHTMVIQVLGLKSAPATGTKVVVDGFIVHT
jgi:bacillopeptidase F